MELINTRRSVRKYKNDKLNRDDIMKVLKAGMQAPSARNQQPWEFIVIEDLKIIEKIKLVSSGAKNIENAPCVIAVLFKDNIEVPFNFFAVQDLGACVQNILLEATHLQLGSLWVGVHNDRQKAFQEAAETNKNIYAFIALGYPENNEVFKFVDRFDEAKISFK